VELSDGEIVLRPWRLDDLGALVVAIDDPEIGRWMPKIPHPYTAEAGAAYLARSTGREGRFAIVTAGTGELVGGISLVPKHWGRAEIGYWIRADARGRGLATRALVLVSRWGFERGFRRLQLHADVGNPASHRVAEKAGFVREGVLRSWIEHEDSERDHIVFSLLRRDLSDRADDVGEPRA
jgi:[ribosomal protein S5]-alanine N-acetyltransferase